MERLGNYGYWWCELTLYTDNININTTITMLTKTIIKA